ncbi:MAG: phosphoribosylglycinamide formyltransferase [Puniceicoccales bacterium]|jgi:phosphoribosylglycinamide formyltransferase-1|nr:phosphoribosylglycinamide formyltransferase [Puniceicoccales bacterium]
MAEKDSAARRRFRRGGAAGGGGAPALAAFAVDIAAPRTLASAAMNIAILGSGRGSNAEAILAAQAAGQLGRARVAAIFCDIPGARILALGPRFGVPAFQPDSGPFKTKFPPEIETVWANAIRAAGGDFIVLAGFMRVVKAPLLDAFAGRIINLHPSLLPAFAGLDGIGQAWRYGVKVAGCTVHYVNAEVDGGAIIDQAVVRREDADTPESFAEKIHAAEHRLLPDVIRRLSLAE